VRELDDRDASAIGAWIASGREGPAPDDSDAKWLTAAMVALRPELDEVAILAADAVAGELTEALNAALTIEARLIGLQNALLERARDGTNSSAGHAAERLAIVIRAAKRAAGVKHNAESGRRLLAALASDPGAKLQ
jgi:hypothetical protein